MEHEPTSSYLFQVKFSGMRKLIDFCMSIGLIASDVPCDKCEQQMMLVENSAVCDGFEWECQKDGPNAHHCKRDLRTGSWFGESTHSIWDTLWATYLWAYSYPSFFRELRWDSATGESFTSLCREVCAFICLNSIQKCGGNGRIVDMDEFNFVKSKFDRGNVHGDGKWMYGGVERKSGRSFFIAVPDRTKESLMNVIREYVVPGSIVISDIWISYNAFEDEDLKLLRKQKRLRFVVPENISRFEEMPFRLNYRGPWSDLKHWLSMSGADVQFNCSYMMEYAWRKAHIKPQNETFLEYVKAVNIALK